jgi:hypothetical protein
MTGTYLFPRMAEEPLLGHRGREIPWAPLSYHLASHQHLPLDSGSQRVRQPGDREIRMLLPWSRA